MSFWRTIVGVYLGFETIGNFGFSAYGIGRVLINYPDLTNEMIWVDWEKKSLGVFFPLLDLFITLFLGYRGLLQGRKRILDIFIILKVILLVFSFQFNQYYWSEIFSVILKIEMLKKFTQNIEQSLVFSIQAFYYIFSVFLYLLARRETRICEEKNIKPKIPIFLICLYFSLGFFDFSKSYYQRGIIAVLVLSYFIPIKFQSKINSFATLSYLVFFFYQNAEFFYDKFFNNQYKISDICSMYKLFIYPLFVDEKSLTQQEKKINDEKQLTLCNQYLVYVLYGYHIIYLTIFLFDKYVLYKGYQYVQRNSREKQQKSLNKAAEKKNQ